MKGNIQYGTLPQHIEPEPLEVASLEEHPEKVCEHGNESWDYAKCIRKTLTPEKVKNGQSDSCLECGRMYPGHSSTCYSVSPEKVKGCSVCGGAMVFIRGRYPGQDRREVCPTCLMERTENAMEMLDPRTYQASKRL